MATRAFDPFLKETSVDWSNRRGNTYAGQAHFAGTGPQGRSCSECAFFGNGKVERSRSTGLVQKSHRCAKYRLLTGRSGHPIPASASACSYFREAPRDPPSKPAVQINLFNQG